MKPVPAVVMPADRPASLGVARSLGRRGIPVHAIDADPYEVAMASRYVKPHPLPKGCSSAEDQLQFLLDFGATLRQKAVLYPVSDDLVMLCSEHRDVLAQYYLWVMPDHQTVSDLLAKDGLHRLAQRHGIPDPQMFRIESRAELEAVAASMPFPAILKPIFSPAWLKPEIVSMLRSEVLSGPPKVAYCRTPDEALEIYERLSCYDNRMIIQEVIPGEDAQLAYFCFYLNRESKPLAVFAGQKLRVLPVGFGSASYVRSFSDPKLEEVSLRLLAETHYQGLGGVEFKKDYRDGQYKLIEFNARLGMWDSFGAKCGVDIPYTAYCDTLGEPTSPQWRYREDVYWVDLQRDTRAFLIYRKHGKLTFRQWLKSLGVEKEWAVYSRNDWKPAVLGLQKLAQRPWDVIRKRFPIIRNPYR